MFYPSEHTLFQTKMGTTALWKLLYSFTQASFGTSFLPNSWHTCLAAFLLTTFQLLPDRVQLKSLKPLAAMRKTHPRSYPVLMNAPPSQRPHMSSLTYHSYILKLLPLPTSRITTLTWKFLNSAGKIKCQCYLPCSNDDFCSIQHYLTFSLSFTLKQGCFKKF